VTSFWDLLAPEDRDAVGERARTRGFGRGEALMHAGQVPRDVYVIRTGLVKVSAATQTGRDVLLAFRGPGDLIGELAALDAQARSATVVALEATDTLVLAGDRFTAVLERQPAVARALLRVLSDRLRYADTKRIQLAGYTAMERVAFCLLELCDRFGEAGEAGVDILLPLSQEELAGWAGSSLESVGRALQQMRRLGWIETRRRAIRVLDREALADVTR
jgi:CRP/FNR family transcriptional regulator, cyclic AMP receptor protein